MPTSSLSLSWDEVRHWWERAIRDRSSDRPYWLQLSISKGLFFLKVFILFVDLLVGVTTGCNCHPYNGNAAIWYRLRLFLYFFLKIQHPLRATFPRNFGLTVEVNIRLRSTLIKSTVDDDDNDEHDYHQQGIWKGRPDICPWMCKDASWRFHSVSRAQYVKYID